MASGNLDVYMPIVIMMSIGVITVLGAGLLSRLIRPHRPTELKETPYECGELPEGVAWSFFNVRFYVVGLIFIIFDVESSLMFPVAVVFKKMNQLGMGGLVLLEVILFLLILFVGIVYCWSKGDLEWVKSYQNSLNKPDRTIKGQSTHE